MATIRYTFADGHTEEVEVSEEFKREYERIERQSHSNDEKFRWRARKRETSLEKLREEVGLDIPDEAPAIDEQAIEADFIERFTSVLTKPQNTGFKSEAVHKSEEYGRLMMKAPPRLYVLYYLLYVEGKTQYAAALEQNVTDGHIRNTVRQLQQYLLDEINREGGTGQ